MDEIQAIQNSGEWDLDSMAILANAAGLDVNDFVYTEDIADALEKVVYPGWYS